MKSTPTTTEAKQAVIAQLVKQNVAIIEKMNGIGWNCLCCIGC